MPLATIHLVSLVDSSQLVSFLQTLKSGPVQPLVVGKVVRWIIRPTRIDAKPLLEPEKPWDLLIILPGKADFEPKLGGLIKCHWSVTTGIPSRLTTGFEKTNAALLHPAGKPPLTGSLDKPRLGSSSQTLEMSKDLLEWIGTFSHHKTGQSPLSMLNLLAFKPGMKESYLVYGKAFAESIGARRGGTAKLVGNIVSQNTKDGGGWDEFALASYPSILHFADMLASEDYQSVNLRHRVPALEDTLILCTSEIEVEDLLAGRPSSVSKL